jgi:hypothetical protein
MIRQPRSGFRFVAKGENLEDGDLVYGSSDKIYSALYGAECIADGLFERKLDVVHSHSKPIKDYKPGDFYPPWWRILNDGEKLIDGDWGVGHLDDSTKLGHSITFGVGGEAYGKHFVRPVIDNGIDECGYEGYRWVMDGEQLDSYDEMFSDNDWRMVGEDYKNKYCTVPYKYRRSTDGVRDWVIANSEPRHLTISDEPIKRIEAIIKKAEKPKPLPTMPIETFNAQHSYCVSQGQFEGLVFSPIKLSRCGQWAWIHFNTRIHRKHVALVSETRTIRPYNINKVLESRGDAREMAVEAERVNFTKPSIWKRIKGMFK